MYDPFVSHLTYQYLESKYNADKDSQGDNKFLLAWGLIRSPSDNDKRRGITLLQGMVLLNTINK